MSLITWFPVRLRVSVVALWIAASAAAWLVLPQNIALSVRLPFLVAACAEIAMFVATGFPEVRRRLSRSDHQRLAVGLWVSALVPFLLYTVPAGVFSWTGFAALLALTGIAAFWYSAFRTGRLRDAGFLALLAAVMLTGVFQWIYPEAAPRLPSEFLGRIMWIRLGIAAALLLRGAEGTGFGFWPSGREWRTGAIGFLALFPVLFAMGTWLEFFSVRSLDRPWYLTAAIAAGTFLGMFWVVALSEEFFLRGLLQQWMVTWSGRLWLGIALTSLISGALHLPFRGFPNWKFALLATVAHFGYGVVFVKGRGILSAMVTHALVVTVWRIFLT